MLELEELLTCLEGHEQTAWALLDAGGGLVKKGGDEPRFKLDAVNTGQLLAEFFICLEGVFPLVGQPYEVYELELLSGMFVNIYCLPVSGGDLVILQDITKNTMLKKVLHGKTQKMINERQSK